MGYRFNPPPNGPAPPPGWVPAPGWRPSAEWPAPPRVDRARLELDRCLPGVGLGRDLSVGEVRLHRPEDLVGRAGGPHRLVKAEVGRAALLGIAAQVPLAPHPRGVADVGQRPAIVTSQRVIPSAPPVTSTLCVPERIAWRPVSKAERLGVHCASTLKFSNWRPSPARASIRGVGAPRSTPPP